MNSCCRLLIVDDDPAAILISKLAILKFRPGCIIEQATSSQEGIDRLLHENPPELVLLDLKMPCIDGIEFLQTIRAHKELQNLPILILSSSKLLSDIMAAYEAGANDYLFKILNFAEYAENLNGAIHFWIDVNKMSVYSTIDVV
jgi:CheY-like chemotaxis protein